MLHELTQLIEGEISTVYQFQSDSAAILEPAEPGGVAGGESNEAGPCTATGSREGRAVVRRLAPTGGSF